MAKLSNKNILTAPLQRKSKLTEYVFKTKRLEIEIDKNYDIALVLGCSVREILIERTKAAIKLYKDGTVKKLYLSGGVGKVSKYRNETEAEVMKRILIENGIPENDIVIEDKSTTTYENMINTLELIKQECGNNGSIVLVTSDFHQKRSKGMLEKMLREKINCSCDIYSYGVNDGKHDIDNWYNEFSSQKLVRTEALLLAFYVWKKKIDDQIIEKIDVRTRK